MNLKWIFKRKPVGRLTRDCFEWVTEPLPEPSPGQFRVRNLYLSIDPAMRAWVEGDSYIAGVAPGTVMRGRTIAVVEKSRNPEIPEGSIVSGMLGWQTYAISSGSDLDGEKLREIHPGSGPLTDYFSLHGIVGYTAYFGVLDVCRPKAGETFVVSAAAGATGSIAGQIAKLQGCRVVGIAGGREKCSWLVKELGFDGAIDYRENDLSGQLRNACPNGVDIYFDNVGGAILDPVIERMNRHGRVAVCGLISQYNSQDSQQGFSRMIDVLMKRIRIQGFICRDYLPRIAEADRDFIKWKQEGRLKHRVHLVAGLENAPDAVNLLFDGKNFGKLILKISEE
jgi:NADPH-dependent curcumin reductase CurA